MKALKHIPSLLMLAVVACMTAFPVLAFAGLGVLSLFAGGNPHGFTMNGVVKETWRPYIVERFWKDNSFLNGKFVDESDAVVAGRIVHIPQPGSKPTVVKNRTTFPATAVRRTDTDIVYTLDEYTTDPTHIPNIDSIHLSYSKQDSVLGDHVETQNETVADDILIKWASSTNVSQVATTGGATAINVLPSTGQTGNRLAFHQTDLQKLMTRMNTDKVPKKDRYILMDDYMYDGFYNSLSDNQSKDFSRYVDAENGIIGKLHGFNIMTRASVLATTNANAVKALGAAIGATDNLCSLAWQKNSVALAMGSVELFANEKDALYYGDVYSTLVMAGGRARREDGLGIYIVRQGVPA
jgi:hypothetical protein